MNKKTIFKRTILFLCLCLILGACQTSWTQPVPKTEIIFQANIYTLDPQLGFVDANGSNQATLKLARGFEKPVWNAQGTLLFGLSGGTEGDYGYPAYWDTQNGNFKVCRYFFPLYDQIEGSGNPNNPYEVIVQNVDEVTLFDIARCKEVKRLVDYNNTQGRWMNIYGISYNPSSQVLLYGGYAYLDSNPVGNQIIQLDLKTGIEKQIGAGVNPAWSPDGTQIAYVALDGLYVMGPDGSNVRRLVERQFSELSMTVGQDTYEIPFLHWSPDGQLLVYHLCMDGIDEVCNDTNIYKLQVSDGQQVKIISGGYNPSWRP